MHPVRLLFVGIGAATIVADQLVDAAIDLTYRHGAERQHRIVEGLHVELRAGVAPPIPAAVGVLQVLEVGARRAVRGVGGDRDVAQAQRALVGSTSFQDAIDSLPPDLGQKVTRGAAEAFSSWVGATMIATAAIGLVATVVVALLWPRRTATTSDGPPSESAEDAHCDRV